MDENTSKTVESTKTRERPAPTAAMAARAEVQGETLNPIVQVSDLVGTLADEMRAGLKAIPALLDKELAALRTLNEQVEKFEGLVAKFRARNLELLGQIEVERAKIPGILAAGKDPNVIQRKIKDLQEQATEALAYVAQVESDILPPAMKGQAEALEILVEAARTKIHEVKTIFENNLSLVLHTLEPAVKAWQEAEQGLKLDLGLGFGQLPGNRLFLERNLVLADRMIKPQTFTRDLTPTTVGPAQIVKQAEDEAKSAGAVVVRVKPTFHPAQGPAERENVLLRETQATVKRVAGADIHMKIQVVNFEHAVFVTDHATREKLDAWITEQGQQWGALENIRRA